ncbi:MAG: putative nucleotidyltransferase substrate binding domain-containing protein [Hyphomicrobium sp.]
MPQAFDIQNPPFDRLDTREAGALKAKLDIGYWGPGETIIERGKAAENLHVIIKGSVEERDGDEVESILRHKDSFDARALVHGAAGTTFVAAEETLCYLVPKDVILELIKTNTGFAAFFYSEVSRKLTNYAEQHDDTSGGMNQVLRARVSETRLHDVCYIDASATIADAARKMEDLHNNTLFVKDGARTGIITGTNLSKAAVLMARPLDTRVGDVAHFNIFTVDANDFIFEALIKMTRHRVRRLAVVSEGSYIGTLEDIDILGLVAGNSQLIPGRIDRARSIADLEPAARDIQGQVERLHRQGVKVEVIAEITSDLNRALFAKLFELLAPPSIKEAGCLMVMGSEGRGEQTVRTDQDNGLLLERPVPEGELDGFRSIFTAALERLGFPPCPGNIMVRNPQWSQTVEAFIQQIKGWVLTPDENSAMNLGVFFDAVPVAGHSEFVARAKTAMCDLMRGEQAYLARFAKAIDQFEDPSVGLLSSIMATVGVASDAVHIKKSGIFPIVHGVRVLAIQEELDETSTPERLDALAKSGVLSQALVDDLKSALSYLMEIRLRSQLTAMRTNRRDEEAIVRLGHLSARERDLLRDALKVVKRFKEVVRARFHLAML